MPVLGPLSDRNDLSVEYIIDPNFGLIKLDAIAVRSILTRNVPTLSTTGIMITGTALLIIGFEFYRRKYGLSN